MAVAKRDVCGWIRGVVMGVAVALTVGVIDFAVC